MNKLDKKEERLKIYAAYGYECQNCGGSVYQYGSPQLAHLISDSKMNYKKYGAAVIDHPLNRKPTCCLKCNDAMNIGNNPGKCKELIDEIIEQER